MDTIPKEALMEYAYARRLAASAMRQGCTTFGAIVRYVQRKNENIHPLEVFGAMLIMEKMGEVEVVSDVRYRGLIKETKKSPWTLKIERS